MKRAIPPILLILLIASCAPIFTPPTLGEESGVEIDSEFEAAIAQARASLPEFIERVAQPNPTRSIVALKVRFTLPDESTRDIWLDGVTYINENFSGNMGDDLPSLHLAFDDRFVINTADIIDWMIVENKKLIGGLTIRLAYSRMTPDEQKRFLNSLDYSLN